MHALGSSVGYVREDIFLDDQYLLKKGMIVQMPMAVMHSDPQFGATTSAFSDHEDSSTKARSSNLTRLRTGLSGVALRCVRDAIL